MESDGRARPPLSASLVRKLISCSAHFGLPDPVNMVLVIDALADACLDDVSAKFQKWGDAGAAERFSVTSIPLATSIRS